MHGSLYRFCTILTLLAFLTGQVRAHDFWMEAAPYYSDPGKTVDITLHIGNEFVGDTRPNIFNWYDDFSLYSDGTIKEIDGELGDDPAGRTVLEQQGTYLVGHQTTFTYIEIDPKTFTKYLREEGLDDAQRFRAVHGLNDKPARENYIRHAKMLIQSGTAFTLDDSLTEIGYILEISPLQNPYKLRKGDELTLSTRYKGQPAEGLLLIAFSKNNPHNIQRVRTDAKGLATIRLDDDGPWLAKAVKILRLVGQKVDWQSHWASLTFSIKP